MGHAMVGFEHGDPGSARHTTGRSGLGVLPGATTRPSPSTRRTPLQASIATFMTRLPGPEICWVDEHLLVVAGGSRRGQAKPDDSTSLAGQAI